MEGTEGNGLSDYLEVLDPLIGDERTGHTALGIVEGIVAAESLCMNQIASFSPSARRGNRGV